MASTNLTVYVVRLKKDEEIVGIFACQRGDLPWLVDECADVDKCEYASIGAGAILWEGRTTIKAPFPQSKDPIENEDLMEETFTNLFKDASLSESWAARLCGHTRKLKWRQLEHSAETALLSQPAAGAA